MPSREEEIEALKLQVAALTARVYQLEKLSGAAYEIANESVITEQTHPPTLPSETMLKHHLE
jgi:hypothetical protein